jgi:MFS family permease
VNGGQTTRRIPGALFAALGFQVGVWAVLIPQLVASRGLEPAELGLALALMAATSIGALAAAGPIADRVGRRAVAIAGMAGFALSFALLAGVESAGALWPTVALFGVAAGLLDLAANAVGSDYERASGERAMVALHARFSAAAAVGALLAGVVGAETYWVAAAIYAALAAGMIVAPLPPHQTAPGGGLAPGGDPRISGRGRLALLRVPAIAVALAICVLCFFGDGAIEGYAALFLTDVLEAGTLVTGVAFAAYHSASLAGRLVFARLHDERFVLTVAGLAAAAGMTIVVLADSAAVAAAGLLAVGFALAPVIPTALSLAGRSAPAGRGATAIALVTTVGYGAFVAGPPLVGALASATSLRAALVPVIASTAAIALLARAVHPWRR